MSKYEGFDIPIALKMKLIFGLDYCLKSFYDLKGKDENDK